MYVCTIYVCIYIYIDTYTVSCHLRNNLFLNCCARFLNSFYTLPPIKSGGLVHNDQAVHGLALAYHRGTGTGDVVPAS